MINNEIADAYLSTGTIKGAAAMCGCSPSKAKKCLIDTGLLTPPLADEIAKLRRGGLPGDEIMDRLKISRATYNVYAPYQRNPYKVDDCTKNAAKLRRWRKNKKAED